MLTVAAVLAPTTIWPATAQEMPQNRHHGIDWQQMSLSSDQHQRIQQLQSDWSGKYLNLMPQISRHQQHLHELFRNPNSDPQEIFSTQQNLMRLQEQLRNEATDNYLHKRALLNNEQQRMLQAQMHQLVIERQQRPLARNYAQPEENGGIMNVISKVRWAIEPHP
jgi:Spy/CpxP family protein refolding chaperone